MPTFDSIIEQKRSLILETFVSEVRVYRLAPAQRTNSEIADRLDDYLSAVVGALRRGHSKDPEALHLAAAHGEQRARLGYDVIALVGEFGILRSTAVEVARQNNALNVTEMERFCEILHLSLMAALTRFVVSADAHGKTIVTSAHISASAALAGVPR
jgi:hypothetical protein